MPKKMANEKRLIDANALIAKLKEHSKLFVDAWQGRVYMSPSDKARVDEIDTCIAEIINAPTVDAVEVVRCKDCKHWQPIHEHILHMECQIFCGAYEYGYPTNADDFCSYGERRTENE